MKTVLIIDDVADVADALQMCLKHSGYSVSIALTADQGLELARRIRPDFILLDYILRGSLGSSDFLNKLKAENIPSKVILMSGISNPAQKAIQLGIPNSIQKPFEPDKLISMLDALKEL
jgi:two-component system, OmpR family, phosphate regulon response regulator PhoB